MYHLASSYFTIFHHIPSHFHHQVMFWVYGGGFIMGDASEENYLPGPLLDTREVPRTNLNFQNKKLTPNSISCTFLFIFSSAC